MPITLVQGQVLAGRSWGEVVDAFLGAGVDSANTRRVYAWSLRRAFAIMGCASVDEITPHSLALYRESIMGWQVAPATRKQAIAALRSFLRWSRAYGLHRISADIIDVVLRVPAASTTVPYTILSEAEIADLIHAAVRPRDRAMVMVMLGAGLRVSEVSALDASDLISGEPSYLIVRESKGGRSRAVPVRAEVMDALRPLVQGRKGATPVFRTLRGRSGRLRIPGLRERLAQLALRADIHRSVTPHMLRHTYAVRSLLHGDGNVMAISKLLGHRQLSTTQRYLDHLELPDLLLSVPSLPC
jgi:integrase